MSTDFINIVSDKDRLQKELIFYSLFLMVFENFVSHWKETIRSFYSNGMAIDEQTGKYYDFVKVKWHDGQCFTTKDKDKEQQFNRTVFQRIKRNGNNNPKLSMFDWMVDFKLIEREDFDILVKCYDKRNEYAHIIAGCLNQFVTNEEKNLLKSLISISNKAAKQWILEVELPTSAPEELNNFIDENGKYNEPDVISGTQLFYSLVLENLKDIIN